MRGIVRLVDAAGDGKVTFELQSTVHRVPDISHVLPIDQAAVAGVLGTSKPAFGTDNRVHFGVLSCKISGSHSIGRGQTP